jgi:hypothetical protein
MQRKIYIKKQREKERQKKKVKLQQIKNDA